MDKGQTIKKVNTKLLDEIAEALNNIRGWGSVEIYVQDFKVVQITERNIRKTTNNNQHGHIIKVGA
jgi:hypothetical protein